MIHASQWTGENVRLMNHQWCLAWLAIPMLVAGPRANAQDGMDRGSDLQVPQVEWIRLRGLAEALVTEEGTKALFARSPRLMDAYSSVDYFLTFVAPWRPRLTTLPLAQQDAEKVEVEVTRGASGISSFRLTYHHDRPENAITIVKSVWQGEMLLKLLFMRGFANVEIGPTGGSLAPRRSSGRKGSRY